MTVWWTRSLVRMTVPPLFAESVVMNMVSPTCVARASPTSTLIAGVGRHAMSTGASPSPALCWPNLMP